jgi:hypothetical protein
VVLLGECGFLRIIRVAPFKVAEALACSAVNDDVAASHCLALAHFTAFQDKRILGIMAQRHGI